MMFDAFLTGVALAPLVVFALAIVLVSSAWVAERSTPLIGFFTFVLSACLAVGAVSMFEAAFQ